MKVKLWRRVFAASMSAAMLLGLTACGGGSDSTASSESSESSDGIKDIYDVYRNARFRNQ